MTTTWLPAAERVAGAQPGGDMVGGTPRVTHHITADSLNPRPSFEGVRDYLVSAGYEPHLLVDPFSGRIAQFLPLNRSAYALVHNGPQTNRQGTVNIQVEWYFSRGLTVAGKRYDNLAATPMLGLARVLAVAREWGVPDVWPAGKPQWSGSKRNAATWLQHGGHYGHVHVPGNDHTDPGPFVDLPPAKRPLTNEELSLLHKAHMGHPLDLHEQHVVKDLKDQGLI